MTGPLYERRPLSTFAGAREPKGLREAGLAPRADVGLQDGVWDSCSAERHLALSKARCKPPSPLLCRRQKGVRWWLVGLSFRFPCDPGQSLSFLLHGQANETNLPSWQRLLWSLQEGFHRPPLSRKPQQFGSAVLP